MDREIQQRLQWVKFYQECGDAGLVCRRCGISRPTLRKWVTRYENDGLSGLKSISRRTHSSPNSKITPDIEKLILDMRKNRNLGARRLQSELTRLHNLHFSTATIHKVLTSNAVTPIVTYRKKQDFQRYERPIPGDRVQMDTCKIAPVVYQYTAIDDCTRYRVLRCYSRRTAANTLDSIECVIEEMPFPIQRIQTDRGREFFAVSVQEMLKEYGIKFRPNKPASPHLNGKVERSQKTDKCEFYPTVEIELASLDEHLAEWQHYYNWHRPHSALKGKSPIERYSELADNTPFSDDVQKHYQPEEERIQEQNYKLDCVIHRDGFNFLS
ncbi:IS481 family transposase [Vibrio cholerae]|uniref:IS481 family transposase n=1 Tax=Vibrio cholerae TaxID=666 RepID=UPI001C63A651|nr:IS481 family transposase [Vibrio cholerae]HDI3253751.1 IS481 family transposase [Vibrio cholerae]